ncbi:MAG: potassium channel family protein [Myxococcota bacterium]
MRTSNRRANFRWLLITLVILQLVAPLLPNQEPWRSGLVSALVLLAAGAAGTSVGGPRWLRLLTYGLGAAAFSLGVLAPFLPSAPWLELVVFASYILFFGVVCVQVLLFVLRNTEIDANKLYGVCCVYLLAAFAWAFLYAAMERMVPGSFSLSEGSTSHDLVSEMVYFSVVTITTLGYGDVTPVSPIARTVSGLEALLGQGYLTVLVARLMGWSGGGTTTSESVESQSSQG